MLVGLKSTQTVAEIVREVKKVSSNWVSDNHFPRFQWQEGYGAFTFGYGDLGRLMTYVQNQAEHHKTVSSVDELLAILEAEHVPYDSRYFN